MAHMMKNNRNACSNLIRHFERNENIKEYSNENINLNKSYLNYNLGPFRENQLEFIKSKCEELKVLNRKDVNVMCNWVVTLPKDLDVSIPGNEDNFFKKVYDFLENRYGKENVISSYVHKDEITPHMHFAFVPVVYDKKKDKFKISAKECVNREDLRTFHEDLQEYLDKYAVKCSIINESTKNGNKSIKELKRGSASEMMLSAHREVLREKAKLEPIRREFAFKQAAIDKINEEFLKLRKENEKLKKDLEVASMQREAMFDTLVNHDLFEEYADNYFILKNKKTKEASKDDLER